MSALMSALMALGAGCSADVLNPLPQREPPPRPLPDPPPEACGTCAANECGPKIDPCTEESFNCGDCEIGYDCVDGACECVPQSATQICGAGCGPLLDRCGLTVDCGPCQGVVRIDLLVDTIRPLVKVVFIVDNSDTMQASQALLADGVTDLLATLQGNNAEFYVYTTTQSGTDSAAATYDTSSGLRYLVDWQRDDGQANNEPMTSYAHHCVDTNDDTISCSANETRTRLGSWSLARSLGASGGHAYTAKLTPDLTDIAAVQIQLANAIANVGIGGDSREQPLCSLARLVESDAILGQGDRVVFVVISDEDDDTSVSECLRGYQLTDTCQEQSTNVDCTSGDDCTLNQYAVRFRRLERRVTLTCRDSGTHCVGGDGNTAVACPDEVSLLIEAPVSSCVGLEQCTAADNLCSGIYEQRSCDANCRYYERDRFGYYYECHKWASQVGSCAEATAACQGSYFPTSDGYELADCWPEGYRTVVQTVCSAGYPWREYVGDAADRDDLRSFFLDRATSLFGESFFVAAIIHDPTVNPDGCTPDTGGGQEYGTYLATLADGVFSICDSSYAAALEWVAGFVQTDIINEFPLPLEPEQTISAVEVVHQDEGTDPVSPVNYGWADGVLIVDESELLLTDLAILVTIEG